MSKIALAYSNGLEAQYLRSYLQESGVKPLFIVCKAYDIKPPKWTHVKTVLNLRNEKVVILRRKFIEHWNIREDFNPHRWSLSGGSGGYTNTILEWAKKQPARPFDTLYLGRRIEDIREEPLSFEGKTEYHPEMDDFDPPSEAFGFKLVFPYWKWQRRDGYLFPPEENWKIGRLLENEKI